MERRVTKPKKIHPVGKVSNPREETGKNSIEPVGGGGGGEIGKGSSG